jgi:hypothetical protein
MGKNQTIDLILGMTAAVATALMMGPDRARQHRNAAGHGPRGRADRGQHHGRGRRRHLFAQAETIALSSTLRRFRWPLA